MKSLTFANQKGGVGKTSITIMFANYVSSIGSSVVVVDCDVPQKSAYRTFLASDNPGYDVVLFDPSSEITEWKNLIEEIEAFDYALFDIPGTMLQGGIVKALSMIDKIIIPTSTSPKELDSTRIFITEFVRNLSNTPDIKVLFNKLEPHMDQSAREVVKALKENGENEIIKFLGISDSEFFSEGIKLERAAIEKNLAISEIHAKINTRYTNLLNEIVDFVNN